jgi:hypothetical protein
MTIFPVRHWMAYYHLVVFPHDDKTVINVFTLELEYDSKWCRGIEECCQRLG